MFLKQLHRFRHTIAFRLTAYYGAIFAGTLVIALLLIDRGFWAVLRRRDRNFLREEMRESAVEYREEKGKLRREPGGKHSDISVLRIANAENRTIAYFAPDRQGANAQQEFEKLPLTSSERWQELQIGPNSSLDVGTMPLPDGNFLQVARSDHDRRVVIRHFERISVVVALPMLLITTIGGALLAGRTLRPVHDLNVAVRQIIETGKTDARLSPGRTARELRELVAAFNEMLARVDGLIRVLKGTLDNVAHDLRTPISRLRGIAELALRGERPQATLRDALADCMEESERVMQLLDTIMDITEAEAGAMKLELRPVSLATLAGEIAELYQHVAEEKRVALVAAADHDLRVMADPNRLRQAIANLIDNAIKYTPAGGRVQIVTSTQNNAPALRVEDTGIGIAAEEQERVWERLYRCDCSRSQRGAGLGLSLVRAIMQAHQGRAELVSTPGVGSTFTLCFAAEG
jgi:signal transduction histidine kinase